MHSIAPIFSIKCFANAAGYQTQGITYPLSENQSFPVPSRTNPMLCSSVWSFPNGPWDPACCSVSQKALHQSLIVWLCLLCCLNMLTTFQSWYQTGSSSGWRSPRRTKGEAPFLFHLIAFITPLRNLSKCAVPAMTASQPCRALGKSACLMFKTLTEGGNAAVCNLLKKGKVPEILSVRTLFRSCLQ